jgi:hypothetical protein
MDTIVESSREHIAQLAALLEELASHGIGLYELEGAVRPGAVFGDGRLWGRLPLRNYQ